MSFENLTLKSIRARPVVLKLKRPVVARIATLAEWPLILIDLMRARRGGTGSKWATLRGGVRRTIPFPRRRVRCGDPQLYLV
jgi:hypothetical protein